MKNYFRCLVTMKASIAHQRQPPPPPPHAKALLFTSPISGCMERLYELYCRFKMLFLLVHRYKESNYQPLQICITKKNQDASGFFFFFTEINCVTSQLDITLTLYTHNRGISIHSSFIINMTDFQIKSCNMGFCVLFQLSSCTSCTVVQEISVKYGIKHFGECRYRKTINDEGDAVRPDSKFRDLLPANASS